MFCQHVLSKRASVLRQHGHDLRAWILSTCPSCVSAWRTRCDPPRNRAVPPWRATRSRTAAAIQSSPKTPPQRENPGSAAMAAPPALAGFGEDPGGEAGAVGAGQQEPELIDHE